jgi:hypothetical protein
MLFRSLSLLNARPAVLFAVWNCVIFVRDGLYQDAILKFDLYIPDGFPTSECPTVQFTTQTFHPVCAAGMLRDGLRPAECPFCHCNFVPVSPYAIEPFPFSNRCCHGGAWLPLQAIDPHTGFVELSTTYPQWRKDKDHIWHLVGYIKSIFYEISTAAQLNPEASHLYVCWVARRCVALAVRILFDCCG